MASVAEYRARWGVPHRGGYGGGGGGGGLLGDIYRVGAGIRGARYIVRETRGLADDIRGPRDRYDGRYDRRDDRRGAGDRDRRDEDLSPEERNFRGLEERLEAIINSPPDSEERRRAIEEYNTYASRIYGSPDARFEAPLSIVINGREITIPAAADGTTSPADLVREIPSRATTRAPDAPPAPTYTHQPSGEAVTLAADTVITPELALQIINAPSVTRDGQTLTPSQRLRTVLDAATAGLRGTPPDLSILEALRDPNAQTSNNVNALYQQLSTKEKQEYNAALIQLLTAARDREGVPAEERAALDRDIARLQAAQNNPDSAVGASGSFLDMLREFFQAIIAAIRGEAPPGQDTAPGGADTAPGGADTAPGGATPVEDPLTPQVDKLTVGAERPRAVDAIVGAAMTRVGAAGGEVNGTIGAAERPYFAALNRAFDAPGDQTDLGLTALGTAAMQDALRVARQQGITADQFVVRLVNNDPDAIAIASAARQRAQGAGQAPT